MDDGAAMARRRSPLLHPQIQVTEEGTGVTRQRSRGTSSLALQSMPFNDDMLHEILTRLPPRPSSLPRASAVCKRWLAIVTDSNFQRQFRAHHSRKPPPLLGAFVCTDDEIVFTPVLDAPDRIPPERFSLGRCSNHVDYDLLECRHGLVLVKNMSRTEVLVCDPIIGEQRSVAIPLEFRRCFFNGAVLCATTNQANVRAGRRFSPFKVVFMSMYSKDNQLVRVYSSETDTWGNLIATEAPYEISDKPAVLIGNCLYWSAGDHILELDLDIQNLAAIMGPPVANGILNENRQIIRAADDSLGYAILSYPSIHMWQRNIHRHGVATWVPWKTVKMHKVLGLPSRHERKYAQTSRHERKYAQLLGYDDDDDLVFLYHEVSVYMVQLKSMQSRKLDDNHFTKNRYYPFRSFYTQGTAIAGGFNGAEMLHIG